MFYKKTKKYKSKKYKYKKQKNMEDLQQIIKL